MNEQDSLSTLLKTWRHKPNEEPGFSQNVWAQIRAEQGRPAETSFLAQLLAFPSRGSRWAMPAAASILLLFSLATGSGVAYAYSSLTRNDRMAAEYARSIDPLQMIVPPGNS
jgi:hypothetical protein